MKVYFIGSGYDGCSYVRCMLPLQANGWWGDWATLGAGKDSQEQMLKACRDADVVVFQRPMKNEFFTMAEALRAMGKKIVFDNDDTYKSDSGAALGVLGMKIDTVRRFVDEVNDRLFKFAQFADLVTVSTETLKEEYLQLNKNVEILPNCVCVDDWDEPQRNEGEKIRIGLSGSVGFSEDYVQITEILEELAQNKNVQLVVFSIPADEEKNKWQRDTFYKQNIEFFEKLGAEFQPTVPMADYIDTLNNLKLDIMLIPRKDNYFNQCKSNIKYLEASMLEIPCIVSSFEGAPYEKDETLKAKSLDDWRQHLKTLMDKDTRRKLGKKAKEFVITNYNIDDKAHLWVEAYKRLF